MSRLNPHRTRLVRETGHQPEPKNEITEEGTEEGNGEGNGKGNGEGEDAGPAPMGQEPTQNLNQKPKLNKQPARRRLGPEPLDPRELAFVDAYLAHPTANASQAALAAGYANPGSGSLLLKRARVRQEIERRCLQGKRNAEAIVDKWWACLEASYSDYAGLIGAKSAKTVRSELAKLKASGKDLAIKRLKLTRQGIEVELHDQIQVSELLGKHLGLLKDQLDVTLTAPQIDREAQLALLQDPEACKLACQLDARLALPNPHYQPHQPQNAPKTPPEPSPEPIDVEWSKADPGQRSDAEDEDEDEDEWDAATE